MRPGFGSALSLRGAVHFAAGDFPAALADYQAAHGLEPDDPGVLNSLAWLRATCPMDGLRDAGRAVADAMRACELTGHAVPGFVDTLAAAYAEAGRFADAVRWQEKVVDMVPADQQAEYQARLDLYRSGQPYREPARPSAANPERQ